MTVSRARMCVRICVCVCEYEGVCVRESLRERVLLLQRHDRIARARMCVCVRVCVCVCVYECVCERERVSATAAAT